MPKSLDFQRLTFKKQIFQKQLSNMLIMLLIDLCDEEPHLFFILYKLNHKYQRLLRYEFQKQKIPRK